MYCCIGTTRKKTPNKKIYKDIDFGVPVKVASLAKENGIGSMLILSSLGANSESFIFYNRVKGEMENEILNLHIKKTHFLRPSLIGGKRDEKRIGELILIITMKILNFSFVGSLEKYRTIDSLDVARAMMLLANSTYEGVKIESDQIKKLVHQYDRNRA